MSPDAQRIAIAEACGWKIISNFGSGVVYGQHPNYPSSNQVPDYLHDLNAMHEAQKLLKPIEWENYRQELWLLCADNDIRATAAQRAEAFLRTVGKWEDSQQGGAK